MKSKKDILPGLLVIFALVLIVGAALYVIWPQLQPHATLHIGDGIFKARVAKTADERQSGLSGTRPLSADQAMIFVFNTDEKWSMWMKDMNYPIDIVWLDKEKRVVYIVKNVPPDSFPDKFTPKTVSRYVVELPAGTVDKKAIRTGAQATFDENNLSGIRL